MRDRRKPSTIFCLLVHLTQHVNITHVQHSLGPVVHDVCGLPLPVDAEPLVDGRRVGVRLHAEGDRFPDLHVHGFLRRVLRDVRTEL